MISTHIDPFTAFCKDLHIAGVDVHLYRGANTFGCTLEEMMTDELPGWWDKENIYFLAGVNPGIRKRAADIDVRWRGMFTLDFDIRKELPKMTQGPEGQFPTDDAQMQDMAEKIIVALEKDPMWGRFRYVVMSGNGMHVHYFGEPAAVVKEQWVAGMKNVFEEIAKITPIPPDFGCGNAGRIMRMPGSWNVKDPTKKKPVDVVIWMPGYSLPPLQFVQERGIVALSRQQDIQQAKKQEFVEAGGRESDLIELINSIPIEQVVAQLFAGMHVKQVKKDGGMRFADEKGEERGFFKHHQYNIVVHEGTSLFPPPAGKGYNPLGLVKTVLKLDAHSAIQWFCERSAAIRTAQQQEKEEWLEEHNSQHVFDMKAELAETA